MMYQLTLVGTVSRLQLAVLEARAHTSDGSLAGYRQRQDSQSLRATPLDHDMYHSEALRAAGPAEDLAPHLDIMCDDRCAQTLFERLCPGHEPGCVTVNSST